MPKLEERTGDGADDEAANIGTRNGATTGAADNQAAANATTANATAADTTAANATAAGQARVRLAALRDEAAAAYDAIIAADADLRVLAARRVAAERVLRHDAARGEAAARALSAHDRARPGPVTRLAAASRTAQWRARQAELGAALEDVDRDVTLSRAAVGTAKEAFAARVAVRAEAVADLHRLTAECAAVTEEIVALGGDTTTEPGLAAGSGFLT